MTADCCHAERRCANTYIQCKSTRKVCICWCRARCMKNCIRKAPRRVPWNI
nr:MAG TPA: hypothetical protein [Caudoviricetes sp.]